MPAKKRIRKRNIVFLLLLILVVFIAYVQLFYKPRQVNSGIFKTTRVITGHTGEVWVAKFSPGDSLIASGGVDSTVRIWRKSDGALLHILKHPAGVTFLQFSSDGAYLVTSSYDGKVRLWQLSGEKPVKEFIGHQGTVWTVDISTDGTRIASAGEDKKIKIWNAVTGEVIYNLPGHSRNIWSLKISPDGTGLASGSFDASVKLWDLQNGKFIKTLEGHSEAMATSVIDNNGVYLIPAFSGLGAPHWDMNRKASITGLTFDCNKNHIVRAALESIPYQIKDVIAAMEQDAGIELEELMVDGGITSNRFVLQFLADLLKRKIVTIGMQDVSGLGAAYMAGLKTGIYKSIEHLKTLNSNKNFVEPSENEKISGWYEGWKELVRKQSW